MKYHKRNCKFCNFEFKLYRPSSKTKFCSHKCAQQQKSKDTEKFILVCLNCKKEFEVLKGSVGRKCCSYLCKNKYQSISNSGENNPNFGNHILKGKKRSQKDIEKIRLGAIETWKSIERKEKQFIGIQNYYIKNGFYPAGNPANKEKRQLAAKLRSEKGLVKTFGKCGKYISKKH